MRDNKREILSSNIAVLHFYLKVYNRVIIILYNMYIININYIRVGDLKYWIENMQNTGIIPSATNTYNSRQ